MLVDNPPPLTFSCPSTVTFVDNFEWDGFMKSFKGCYKEVKRMVATQLDPALFSRVLKVHLHLSQAHVGRRKSFVVANLVESIVQLFSSPANV